MFEQVLSKKAKDALVALGKTNLLNNTYMAGGTALALHIGHRYSKDFDFFTNKEFDESILVQRIKKAIPDFQLERKEWGTILGSIKDFRFSMFFYRYPLLAKTHDFLNVEIVDVKDIAGMKIAAISDRGTKKDFIDLYFIINIEKIFTLEETLELYDKKFKSLKENNIHILKSLQYFEDADQEKMPRMIKDISWREIKQFFEKETKRITKSFL